MGKIEKTIIIMLTLSFIIGCGHYHWSNFYPYSKINPENYYRNLPVDYENCLLLFDSLLSSEVITHYRMEDSSVAYIKISQAIGNAFINFWNLSYYKDNYNKLDGNGNIVVSSKRYQKPQVLDKFISDSISDPQAMVRILFKCYHKKLNNFDYDWDEEIATIKSYWENPQKGEGWISKTMREREYEILLSHHFQELSVGDTVDVLYNGPPRLLSKIPDWYYLTGIIQKKHPENHSINIKHINIETEFEDMNYIKTDNEIINIGDTATYPAEGWLKRGTYYFDYHKNKEYRESIGKNYH